MAVIGEYIQGSCKIIVYDDDIQPEEEVKKTIQNISRIVMNDLWNREQLKKQDKNNGL